MKWRVGMLPEQRRKLDLGRAAATLESSRASVQAKVEYPFLRVKWQFGYAKVRH